MPTPGNQFKNSNSFRDTTKSKSVSKERVAREKEEMLPKFTFNDRRLVKIIGLFFLIVSLYFMVAFTSYLFTWQDDQSYVLKSNGGWGNLFKTQKELLEIGLKQPIVQNWLGKLGALLAHQFIYEWFGVSSFIFIGIFFIIGYRLLFKVKIWSIKKSLGYCFFLLLFISILLGYGHGFVSDYPHYLEGAFGFWTNRLLQTQIGNTGTAGLLAFAGLSALIIAYNIDFHINLISRNNNRHTDIPDTNTPDTSWDETEDEPLSTAAASIAAPLEFDLNTSTNTSNVLRNDIPLVTSNGTNTHELEILTTPQEVLLETLPPIADAQIQDIDPQNMKLSIEKTVEEKTATELVEQFGMFDPKLDLSNYKYPTLDLLENHGANKILVNTQELEANKNKIVETLNHYNIEIDKIKATIGPTVTLYEIIPAPGVRRVRPHHPATDRRVPGPQRLRHLDQPGHPG